MGEKSTEKCKILKTLCGSSPIYALSFHSTFSQTKTGATIPLINSKRNMALQRKIATSKPKAARKWS
jgi:hypothetical protein